MDSSKCRIIEDKEKQARELVKKTISSINKGESNPLNAIWLEAAGCSGNIISFINGENPGLNEVLTKLINLKYNNSIMGAQGELAFEQFLKTLDTEFVLLVDGAVSTKNNGMCNIIADYRGRKITGLEAVKLAGAKAKYIVSVGTCASHGGISAAKPNPTECKSVSEVLGKRIIKVPGCPAHPDWVIGTLAYLVYYGMPELDSEGRPLLFYGITIHDRCTRRSFFDMKIFATNLGDKECMFKLGCRGPVTKTDCPVRKWNGYVNWPVEDNTPCIGCANSFFPDGMEPFVRL